MNAKRRAIVRRRLFDAQGGRCCYCGIRLRLKGGDRSLSYATVEHLRRRSDGGTSHDDNLALACNRCNSSRGDTSWVEFKTMMAGAR